MNDNELITAVRESVADVRAATPVAKIISRGRAVRARRRIPAVAGALAAGACTGLAVTTLVSAGHPGVASVNHPSSHPASVRLTAWTVARQANGNIDVTIRQLKNPAGLQATLRADGLPVTVSFSGRLNPGPACRPYSTALGMLNSVSQIHGDRLVIDPSALPSGAGLAIFDEPGKGLPVPSGTTPTLGAKPATPPSIPRLLRVLNGPLAIGMVYASQQCTG